MYCLQLFFNIGKTRDISAGLRDKKSTTTSKLHECNASFQVSTFLKSPMILCTLSGICFLCIPRFSTVISQPLFKASLRTPILRVPVPPRSNTFFLSTFFYFIPNKRNYDLPFLSFTTNIKYCN